MVNRRCVAALLLLLLAASGCGPSGGSDREVVLVGDSIAQETSPYLHEQLGDTKVVDRVFGGTAPCDWLDEHVEVGGDDVAVVSFTGNSLTPCMADDHGGQLHGQALVDRYHADLMALVEQLRSGGARVLLVRQPPRGPNAPGGADATTEVDGINAVYEELADGDDIAVVDAGAALEGPDGAFAAALPCLPDEQECGPDGTNTVRSDDGVHLCPVEGDLPCPVYSSGAFRVAVAIADAIEG